MGFSWAFINPAADNPPDLSVTTSGLAATASLTPQGLTASVAGGTSPYVYAWSAIQPDGDTSVTEFSTTSGSTTLFTPAAIGLYTVTCTVTDDSTTTLTASSAQSKVIGTDLAATITGIEDSLSITAQDVTASVTGGTGGESYTWFVVRADNTTSSTEYSNFSTIPLSRSATFTPSIKGLNVLSVIVEDDSGAIVTATSSISLGVTGSDLNVGTSGLAATSSLAPQTLSSSVVGGIAPYNFTWSSTRPNGSTSTSEFDSTTSDVPVFSPQRVGLYSVTCTVTDTPDVVGTGLTASSTQTKFIGEELSAVITGLTATGSTATQDLTASATGGTGSYSYFWSVNRPDGTISTSEFSGGDSNASASVFFDVGYAGHNVVRCDITDASSVTFRATASAEIGITGSDLQNVITGFTASSGLLGQPITASVAGGIEPYTLLWSAIRPDGNSSTSEFTEGSANASGSVLFTPVQVGLYSVTCTATDSSSPILTASSNISNVVGTTLSVTITGLSSATSMAAQDVTASVNGGTGGEEYFWSNSNYLSTSSSVEYSNFSTDPLSQSATFTPSVIGLNALSVRVVDSSGVSSTVTASAALGVTGSDLSLTTAGLAATSSLEPQNLTATVVSGAAPFTFSWVSTQPDGEEVTSEFDDATTQNPVFSPTRVGLYSVNCTVIDSSVPALTASSAQAAFIGVELAATITGTQQTSSMAAQDLTASATGGTGSYTFQWSAIQPPGFTGSTGLDNFSTDPLSQSVTFTPSIPGLHVFRVTITDSSSETFIATSSVSIGITGSDFALTTAGLAATASLADQNLTATVVSGASPYAFSWTAINPTGAASTLEFNDATTQNPTFTPKAVGLYTVVCTATDSSVPALTASSSQSKFIGEVLSVSIAGLATTSSVASQDLTASVTGGSGSYTFSWSSINPNGVIGTADYTNFSTDPLSQSVTYTASIQGVNVVSVRVQDNASNVAFATASAFVGVTSSEGGAGDLSLTASGFASRSDFQAQPLTGTAVGGTAPLTFAWTATRPGGNDSTSEFDNAANQEVLFTPTQVGLYTVTCTVSDDATPTLSASHAQSKVVGTELAGVITGSSGLDLATPSSSLDLTPQSVTASITGAGAGGETYFWSCQAPGDPNSSTSQFTDFITSPLSQSATFTPATKGVHTLFCHITDSQGTNIVLSKSIDCGTGLIAVGEMKTILIDDEWSILQGYGSLGSTFTGAIGNSTNNVGGDDHGNTLFECTTSPTADVKRADRFIYRMSPELVDFGSQFTDWENGGTLVLQMENVDPEDPESDSEVIFGMGMSSNNISASTPATTALDHFENTGTGSALKGSGANINGTIANIANSDFVFIGYGYVANQQYAKTAYRIATATSAISTAGGNNPSAGSAMIATVRILSGGIPDSINAYGIEADGQNSNPVVLNSDATQFGLSKKDQRLLAFVGADKDGTATYPITASYKLKIGFVANNFNGFYTG
jgi:hypothetical protein